jgi:hypothetical protein
VAEGLFTVLGLDHFVAFIRQCLDSHFADKRIILDNQYSHVFNSMILAALI